ncbi:low temperature requirement protein A [Micromonospora sp. 15K316]|uniref:low temperature requirement protein A n=1 Tax=Micromonospora sp. 15K316 TaxID=2530376 RepID=UPI00104EC478|nr:low temperature requirement protein A [Micromonospora sp. 15K316]TDC37536.1 low temperature requirement protein A [Micromonospora sp. 15K316]
MTTGDGASLVRRPDASNRATLLELLFDVVFVAAIALVSMTIAEGESWATTGHALLLFMAIWWTWSVTAVTTDFYDPEQRPLQAVLMVTMLGAVGTAATLPRAVDGHPLLFALAYVAPHVVRGVILVGVLHQHRHKAQERATRFFFWFTVSGILWIVGALLPNQPHWPLWAAALAIEYVSTAARYPTPFLGRVPLDQYEKVTEHLGERYQQFVILALGDIILVPTLKISSSDFAPSRMVGFLIVFVTMLLLWQLYVYRSGSILKMSKRRRGRAARAAPYTHLVTLTGVVLVAAGADRIIHQPTGDTPIHSVALMLVGPMLFLVGRTLFTYLVEEGPSWRRLVWIPVLGAMVPFAGGWPPLLVAGAVVVVLAGVVVSDILVARWLRRNRHRGERSEPAPGR